MTSGDHTGPDVRVVREHDAAVARAGRDVWARPAAAARPTIEAAIAGAVRAAATVPRDAALVAENERLHTKLHRLTEERDELVSRWELSRQWHDEAKEAAGYHANVSFDEVWAETLGKARGAIGEVMLDRVAEAIYNAMRETHPGGEKYPWLVRGNSDMQDEARRRARAALAEGGV